MSHCMQETFDLVVQHLANQKGIRSQNKNGACAYRGENGNKCAIGALIPDELYARVDTGGMNLNSTGFQSLVGHSPEINDFFHNEHPSLFDSVPQGKGYTNQFGPTFGKALQSVHDSALTGSRKFQLTELASIFNLNTEKIAECFSQTEPS